MEKFQRHIERAAQALNEANIPYMVIGGQAVLMHGEPRFTRDIDITLGVDVNELEKVLRVVKKISLISVVPNEKEFAQHNNVLLLQDEKDGVRFDLLFSFLPYERQAIRRAAIIKVGNTDVCFATAEDTIIHKMFAGRPRDIEDVKGIVNVQQSLDEKYIEHWLGEFGTLLNKDLVGEYKKTVQEIY